jgi:hypothetical protein
MEERKMKRKRLWRIAVAGFGTALLCGTAGAALADQTQVGEGSDVKAFFEIDGEGALVMSVAADEVELTEVDSDDPDHRLFEGTLPDVTVSDTRDWIDPGVGWTVWATATDFTGPGSVTIPASQLGWVPKIDEDTDEADVTAGPPIFTTLDDPADVGLGEERELLMWAYDGSGVIAPGSWTANARLFLRTDLVLPPGEYASQLTLSLFE